MKEEFNNKVICNTKKDYEMREEFNKLILKRFADNHENKIIDYDIDEFSKAVSDKIHEIIGLFINCEGKDDIRLLAEMKLIGLELMCENDCFKGFTSYTMYYKGHQLCFFHTTTKHEIGEDKATIKNYISHTVKTPMLSEFIKEIEFKRLIIENLFNSKGNYVTANKEYTPQEVIGFYNNRNEVVKIVVNRTTITFLDKLDNEKINSKVSDVLDCVKPTVGDVGLYNVILIYGDGREEKVNLFNEE